MRRFPKYLAIITVVIAVSPFAAFFGYDLLYFQPQRAKMAEIADSFSQSGQTIPEPMIRLLYIAHGETLRYYAAKVILRETNVQREGAAYLLLWGKLVDLHLSEDEQIRIIAARAYLGDKTYGFPQAAQVMFKKPLSGLSSSELATLVALMKSPSYYSESPENLAKQREYLLIRLNSKMH